MVGESGKPDNEGSAIGSTNTGHLLRILNMADEKGPRNNIVKVPIKRSAPTAHLPKVAPSSSGTEGASVPTNHLPSAVPSKPSPAKDSKK